MHKNLAVSLLVAACVSSAFGWGGDGHRIVCRIAYDELSAADRKEANRLAKGYKMPADAQLKVTVFPDVCVFADEARSKAVAAQKNNQTDSPWLHYTPFNNWHFINVTRDTKTIPMSECKDDCVLTAIAKHTAQLSDGTADDQARGEALIFLSHWVGDIHQPLHVSFADDQGGNKVLPVTGGFYPEPLTYPLNLHSVWDSGIIGKADQAPGWRVYADRLQHKITTAQRKKWLAGDPLQWAQESYEITTLPDVEYCKQSSAGCESFGNGRELTSEYQHEFRSTVDLRLEQAGVRLAKLIHDSLHSH